MKLQKEQPRFSKIHFTADDYPLVVDLDGTLINTDVFYEGIIMLVRKNPLYIFACLLWFLKGKVHLKSKVFQNCQLRYELLPPNTELLTFLLAESSRGRKLILATGSLKINALEISKVYPIFAEIYSTETINLTGRNKLNFLIAEFGESNFDYIGNSYPDLKIFASARYSYLVNPTWLLERKARKISHIKHTWRSAKPGLRDYVKAIRMYQWIKNLLIFVPLLTSHSFYSFNKIIAATGAFLAFSMIASSGYIINDLFDLNADRSHPRKRFRPFASGELSIPFGVSLAFVLLIAGLFIASQLDILFLITLLAYFIISVSYSLYFKKMVLYDVFILASLYSARVVAGGLVTKVPLSFWLIAFSTFIFLSLAFVKRYSELMKVTDGTGLMQTGREYEITDLSLLQIMGIVSGFLSVVVFSLYIYGPEVSRLYSHPKLLWGIGFLLLFWISRIWLITNRGKMTDDPIVFAIRDITSYGLFLIIILIIFLSM